MLPVLPFVIGGAIGAVAGAIFKDKIADKMLDNADRVFDGVDNVVAKAENWLDNKQDKLNNYFEQFETPEDKLHKVTTSTSLALQELDDLRVYVYENSFTNFANYFNTINIENTNLEKLEIVKATKEILEFNSESLSIDIPAIMRFQRNR